MIFSKNKYVIGLVITLLVVGVGLLIFQNFKKSDDKNNEPVITKLNNTTETYTDSENGFSFNYPKDIFIKSSGEIQVPVYTQENKIKSFDLTHAVDVEHCGLSGLPEHCTPKTTDLKISFGVIESALTDLPEPQGQKLTPSDAGPNGTKTFEQGVEGEGVIYFFVPLGSEKTLMIAQTYLNESILSKYQTVANFISYAKQGEITKEIIGSIKLDTSVLGDYAYELRSTYTGPYDFSEKQFDAEIVKKNIISGQEEVLVPSIKKAVPALKAAVNLTFNKLAFPANPKKLFFNIILSESDAPSGDIYSFDLTTQKFTKLTISKYTGFGPFVVSPNKLFIATTNDPAGSGADNKLFLVNLDTDSATVLVTLPNNQTFNNCLECLGDNGGSVKWLNADTIEYEVYDSKKEGVDKYGSRARLFIKTDSYTIKQ